MEERGAGRPAGVGLPRLPTQPGLDGRPRPVHRLWVNDAGTPTGRDLVPRLWVRRTGGVGGRTAGSRRAGFAVARRARVGRRGGGGAGARAWALTSERRATGLWSRSLGWFGRGRPARTHSSAGRAAPLQGVGRRFEPCWVHREATTPRRPGAAERTYREERAVAATPEQLPRRVAATGPTAHRPPGRSPAHDSGLR